MIVCFSAGGCTHLPAPSTVERCVVIATRGCFVVVVFFPQVWPSMHCGTVLSRKKYVVNSIVFDAIRKETN